MRFAFTDQQREFASGLREMLDTHCSADEVRGAWETGDATVPGLWARLAEMGVLSMLVPTDHGGMGLDEVDLVLLLAECGRVAVPDPVVETAMVAPSVLPSGDLADLAAGRLRVVADLDGSGTTPGRGDRWLLARGDDLIVVPADAVRATRRASVDGARALTAVAAAPGEEIASAPLGPARARGLVGQSAYLLGLCERMLEITVDYVRQRRQFGVPIGSFQAIKHHCTEALLALDFARPVVWRAAWSLANLPPDGPEAALHASMAKAYAADAAAEVATQALQCHAAIGYTVEYDLHLYMKRAWALQRQWGDARHHRDRVAAAVVVGH